MRLRIVAAVWLLVCGCVLGDATDLIREAVTEWQQAHPTGRVTIQLDKPVYLPGERIWFKVACLRSEDLQPMPEASSAYCQLLSADDEVTGHQVVRLTEGSGGGSFALPAEIAGGVYRLRASIVHGPEIERELRVLRFREPQLKKTLEISGKAYGPGDQVEATAKIRLADDRPLARATVRAELRVDGALVWSEDLRTDRDGALEIRTRLPETMTQGVASLSLTADAGDFPETIVKSIPIARQRLEVAFFPEGGTLVAGQESRMYFTVRWPTGKPADATVVVQDNRGREVARAKTVRHGMGVFEFAPKAGTAYELVIERPVSAQARYPLPRAEIQGVVMRVDSDVDEAGGHCRVTFGATSDNEGAILVAAMRNKLLAVESIDLRRGTTRHKLAIPPMQGLLRLTLLDGRGIPLCERLVYRGRGLDLRVTVRPEREEYRPGEEVTLTVETSLPGGTPCAAELGIAVVDDRVLAFADDKTGHLLAQAYLKGELNQEIEDPNFYLDPEEPDSALALDLLTATAGWRTFAWKKALSAEPVDVRLTDEVVRMAMLQNRRDKELEKTYPGLVDLRNDRRREGGGGGAAPDDPFAAGGLGGGDPFAPGGAADPFAAPASGGDPFGAAPQEQSADAGAVASRTRAADAAAPASLPDAMLVPTLRSEPDIRQSGGTVVQKVTVSSGFDVDPFAGPTADPFAGADPFVAAAPEIREDDIPITMDFDNLPLGEVIRKLCLATGLRYRIDPHAVVLGPEVMPVKNSAANAAVREKLENIILPKVSFEDASHRAVIKYLKQRSKDLDPDQVGTNFYFQGPVDSRAITMDFDNVPFGVVVEYLAESIGMVPWVEGGVVVLAPEGYSHPNFAGRAMTKTDRRWLNRIIIPKISFEDASIRAVLSYLKQRSKDLDPDQIGHNLMLILSGDSQYRWARVRQFPVRQPRTAVADDEQRQDFRHTVYWNPRVMTNRLGAAQVTFPLNDAVTSFRATVTALSKQGPPGLGEAVFRAAVPLSAELRLPAQVSVGDLVTLPIQIANATAVPRTVAVSVQVAGGLVHQGEGKLEAVVVPARGSRTVFVEVTADKAGLGEIVVVVEAGEYRDEVKRTLSVLESGYPMAGGVSGKLRNVAQVEVQLPEFIIPGTLAVHSMFYPNTLGTLLDGIEGMLREPHGCFEQTSAIVYPNLLVTKLLTQQGRRTPALSEKTHGLMERGYKRLLGFEMDGGGFSLFGNSAARADLSAFGLLLFTDMSQSTKLVDPEVVARTRQWLLGQLNQDGGFRGLNQAQSAFAIWALAEAGARDIDRQVAGVLAAGTDQKDPYVLALGLLAAKRLGKNQSPEFAAAFDALLGTIQEGQALGAKGTMMRSWGREVTTESTALALMIMLEEEAPVAKVESCLGYLLSRRRGGRFGSTQATVLSLRALSLYAAGEGVMEKAGDVTIKANGHKETVSYRTDSLGGTGLALAVGNRGQAGPMAVHLSTTADGAMPYALSMTARVTQLPNNPAAPVQMSVSARSTEVELSKPVLLDVALHNQAERETGMVLASIGIPGGLAIQPEQLDAMVDQGEIAYYETEARKVIIYLYDLKPGERKTLAIRLLAEVPGRYGAPASWAQPYYAERTLRSWAPPQTIRVKRLD